jgi:hypothetical protein
MRCILQTFPSLESAVHWLLKRSQEPITMLSCLAVRL